MSIHAIKEAILALPEKDRIELENWLAERWDSQMERDFRPAARAALLEKIDAEIDAGEFRPLDQSRLRSLFTSRANAQFRCVYVQLPDEIQKQADK